MGTEPPVSLVLGAVASLVLLNVQAPGAVRKVDIAEFSTAHKSMEFLPASFTVLARRSLRLHAGRVRFSLPLGAAARLVLERRHRLAITLQLTITSPAGIRVTATRRVILIA